ncbi:TIGR01457 family HAD-type hydrolase [Gemella haemolysans]|uniref:HAD hydrolase, TIGR01457 family n=1 Tax=Gemella haemolysans ATCC 10379 TaxID=546270 RepID=C5NX00_9BACL|nr:TIGR01457 family HAD-type hydrolase [Gemella haemolysans]EER68365.1 HAD hydrolase, TIGR01457 family [Gemella haemolysans ATCC 10379]KAA8707446.1 TIGR01457 family HAD-type hydrolase [Gemella haemolysans]UBH81692.1 TIGR01457 family HAD-type hydrolase [Gemella haemolysans]VEI38401.1 UMP phosphatase [Gemella haemolysans]
MSVKQYKLYLIDLDGTIYNGDKKIKYAKEFVDYLNTNNIDYLFLTNNSTRQPKEVAEHLKNFDIDTSEEHVFTSSDATKIYLKGKGYKNLYVIGESGLKNTLSSFNQKENEDCVDAVVVGLDRKLSYDKLAIATRAILKGAELIGTNPDTLLPTANGFMPSNGGQVKYLEYATSTPATFIGKPSKIIMESAINLFSYSKDEIVMIGDNYDTDIMAGINGGIDTIHVQTGVTSVEDLESKAHKPTYSIKNLFELVK